MCCIPRICLYIVFSVSRCQSGCKHFNSLCVFAYESYLHGVSSSTEQMVSVDSKEIRFHTVTVRETKLLHSNSISKWKLFKGSKYKIRLSPHSLSNFKNYETTTLQVTYTLIVAIMVMNLVIAVILESYEESHEKQCPKKTLDEMECINLDLDLHAPTCWSIFFGIYELYCASFLLSLVKTHVVFAFAWYCTQRTGKCPKGRKSWFVHIWCFFVPYFIVFEFQLSFLENGLTGFK